MLHSYAFSNFQSFRERTEVSWLLDRRVPSGVWASEPPGGQGRISKVMAVIGANASGKTALLKPLLFLAWFITHSFAADPNQSLPLSTYAGAEDIPSEFEVEADVDGQLWRYTLRCTAKRVLHEALYVRRERMRYVFVRDWDDASQIYRIKQQDFGLAPAEARKVRPNASLIATAAQYGVPIAKQIVGPAVWSNVHQLGRVANGIDQVYEAAKYFSASPTQFATVKRLLTSWDLGLADVMLRPFTRTHPDGKTQQIWIPFGAHNATQGTSFELPFAMESSGTQSAFALLSLVLPALEVGGLVVIDEFENDLHPHMLEPILGLFADPDSNPHNAQLLFTCHAIEVLNILHKSQVMLVEKDPSNQSSAWRLDSVEGVRSDDNFYAKYMAGAFGAVPNL
jgi:uncharacterized protein